MLKFEDVLIYSADQFFLFDDKLSIGLLSGGGVVVCSKGSVYLSQGMSNIRILEDFFVINKIMNNGKPCGFLNLDIIIDELRKVGEEDGINDD